MMQLCLQLRSSAFAEDFFAEEFFLPEELLFLGFFFAGELFFLLRNCFFLLRIILGIVFLLRNCGQDFFGQNSDAIAMSVPSTAIWILCGSSNNWMTSKYLDELK